MGGSLLAFFGLAVWIGLVVPVLAEYMPTWFTVLLGAGVPAVLLAPVVVPAAASAASRWRESARRTKSVTEDKEREVLEAAARDRITPAQAAIETSLSVEEADRILRGMVRRGHLSVSDHVGVRSYALWRRESRELQGRQSSQPEADSVGSSENVYAAMDDAAVDSGGGAGSASARGAAPEHPAGLLSRRESEVLRLISSGRTNKEIAGDLFIEVGTVKTHANSIYRKLGARHRSEALAKARELGLL
jgi:ATP/maltotriose-dependent transcriptional regulator MalT